jgi:hypothetical protein
MVSLFFLVTEDLWKETVQFLIIVGSRNLVGVNVVKCFPASSTFLLVEEGS